MIEQTFYVALACNWLMNNPIYRGVIASKRIPNPEYNNPYYIGKFDETIEHRKDRKDLRDFYDARVPYMVESNWFARKPFTCLYCITFWLALLCCVVVPLVFGGRVELGVAFTAPVVAVAFDRWFNSLPVKM